MNNDLKLILDYLNEKRRFDFSGYRDSMVERRVKQRFSASNCKDYDGYLRYLKKHPAELDNLLVVLNINLVNDNEAATIQVKTVLQGDYSVDVACEGQRKLCQKYWPLTIDRTT